MAKQIHMNAFEMNTVGHLFHGLWRHPENNRHRYKDLHYWTELAQLLEKGKFDGLFIADVNGVYDIYKGSMETAVREAVQLPINDPFLVVPAMALVTEHLGFAVTSSTTYEPPFAHARRMSTLDHLTNGRIAWNVVTSHLPNAARNFGLDHMVKHDKRYEIADEYLEVCYKLWEGSWEDDAVVRDADHGVYTDPRKVHLIRHEGEHFNVLGPHLCEPSLQRTPVIYQAGSSDRGRAFAAKHAECVFLEAPSLELLKQHIQDIRERAKQYGRNPDHIKMFTGLSVIVGRTREEAQQKYDEYARLLSVEGALAHFGGGSGFDLSQYRHDEYLQYFDSDHIQTDAARYTKYSDARKTAGQIKESLGSLSARGLLAIGTPEEVADQIQSWAEQSGIDGFNLRQYVSPGTFRDFVELVVPELQKRGIYREQYEPGTFRERLFGKGVHRLPDDHPGARFRHIASRV